MIQIEVIKCREDYKENMRDELIKEFSEQLTDDKQKKVFEILVCPIVASKDASNIGLSSNVFLEKIIISSQVYDGNVDEDMCDFAIGFYEILYGLNPGDILAQSKDKKSIIYWEYAGDTMNSYATVSRYASKEKKKEWKETYHCLANFWMIPGKIGRKTNPDSKNSGGVYSKPITVDSFNKGRRDYMDRFLCEKQKFEKHKFDEFSKRHYIDGVYIKNGEVDTFSYLEETDEDFSSKVDGIINKMMDKICERAVAIVNDKVMCDKLFDYFYSLNLMK